jgi:hypothetical protein
MAEQKEDPVLGHLQFGDGWLDRIEGWLARIFGKQGTEIEKGCFEGNPLFSEAARTINTIGGATHFNHPIPGMDDLDEVDDPDDCVFELRFAYTTAFKGVKSDQSFVVLSGRTGFLIISPLRYWSRLNGIYSSGNTKEITVETFYYEATVTTPGPDDEIYEKTWEHATKSGERDFRYRDNQEVYLVRRYGVTLGLQNKSKWELGRLPEREATELLIAFLKLFGTDVDPELNGSISRDETSDDDAWHEVLGVAPDADEAEIKRAYRVKINQYHPDRVSGLGDKLKIVAEQEAKKINAAKEEGLATQKTQRKTG